MVTRGEPNITELQFSAKGICSNKDDDSVTGKLQVLFEPLAAAYQAIAREKGKKKDFFGLRDFYRYTNIKAHLIATCMLHTNTILQLD